jgi:hypothetical protein
MKQKICDLTFTSRDWGKRRKISVTIATDLNEPGTSRVWSRDAIHAIFCVAPPTNQNIIFSMVLPAHSVPWPLTKFRNHFSQTVGLLGRVISPSQGPYLNTGQHKTQNKHIYTPNIHAFCGIRNHDPSVRASENISCLRPRGYCDRLKDQLPY